MGLARQVGPEPRPPEPALQRAIAELASADPTRVAEPAPVENCRWRS